MIQNCKIIPKFAAAMLDLALVSFIVLNLAGYQALPALGSVQPGASRHRGDVIYAVCLAICQSDQTMSGCEDLCKDEKDMPELAADVLEEPPSLLCRNSSSLVVGWSPRDSTAGLSYMAELMVEDDPHNSASLTVDAFTVTQDAFVKFANLNESSKYYVRLTAYNSSGQLGDPLITEELWTLPDNFTLGAPTNMSMEDVKLNSSGKYQGILKWTPAEDRACFYDLYVFTSEVIFTQLELKIPTDLYSAKIFDMELSTTYVFNLFAMNANRDKESKNSWFTYTTMSCLDTHKNLIRCAPPQPDVTVTQEVLKIPADYSEDPQDDASPRSFSSYDITVNWTKPQYLPDYYLINISSSDNKKFHESKNISGSKTSVTFENANIGLAYFVTITAVSPGGHSKPAYVHREVKKPKPDSHNTGALLWAILGPIVAFVGVVAIGVFVYHRHEKLKLYKKRCRYFEELEQKAPKEAENGSSFNISPEDDAFEVIPEKIILYEVLGEGAFGVVRKGWLPDKNREVAVKMLKDEPSAEEVKQFRQEIDMMKSVGSHAHIVSLVGCCTRPTSTMFLIVEFCAKGDLQNYLRWAWDLMISQSAAKPLLPSDMNLINSANGENSNSQIKYAELLSSENSDYNGAGCTVPSQPNLIVNRLYELQHTIKESEECAKACDITAVDLISFSRQIAMGMEFLSSNRVVHRDLAARNVLVCSDKTVKIADFGLSRDIYQENMYKKTGTGKLPIKWMALESLTHQVYTTQSDVWSFGILLWEIVTLGGNPYPSVPTGRLMKLLQSGYRMDCPNNCTQDLYNLMLNCWQTRPKDRPSFSEIRLQLDKLLDEMCSQEYLNLDIIDYKDINETRLVSSQLSKESENNQSIARADSERYIRPVTTGKKAAIQPAQPNHYITQPLYAGNYPSVHSTNQKRVAGTNSFPASLKNQGPDRAMSITVDQRKLSEDLRIPNGSIQQLAVHNLGKHTDPHHRAQHRFAPCLLTQYVGH